MTFKRIPYHCYKSSLTPLCNNHFRWFGHIERRPMLTVRKSESLEVIGTSRRRGERKKI